MSILLPTGLPAATLLRDEGIAVEDGAAGGVALRLLLVNLMPDKAATETQFARLLAASRHRVALSLAVPPGAVRRDATAAHVAASYLPWDAAIGLEWDAVLVTGAPVERHPFVAVRYWRDLVEFFDRVWARGIPGLYVCWGAQAALWHAHGVAKHELASKASGVFPQRVRVHDAGILRGIGPTLLTPVSRHTEVRTADLSGRRGLRVLADSTETGLCLAQDTVRRAHLMLNHLEYDADTLAREYARDLAAGAAPAVPRDYFPGDDPGAVPVACWRPHARRFFANWLEDVAAGARPAIAVPTAARSVRGR